MPNFERLRATGGMARLATSMPPQSPVAWSNVISGSGPGTHEIYDFIHRDPSPSDSLAILPYLSTSTVETPESPWYMPRESPLGRWHIPLSGETVKLERQGPTFWDSLVGQGIDTTIYRMPANYPAREVEGDGVFQTITGMGTPDLLGSYGEFTVFTPNAPRAGRIVAGGKFVQMRTIDDRAEAAIDGPPNHLRVPSEGEVVPPMQVTFVAVRDAERDLIKLTLGDDLVILKQGDWSRWIPISFETGIPGSTVLGLMQAPTSLPGMVRFYVKEVHPNLVLFATPINIDPSNPANPISVPPQFAADLAIATGPYFTAGIPEHTPEVQGSGLDEDQWLAKANMILDERIEQYRYALANFKSGFLFFYFGSPDQISHIFWRDQDPDHPGRDPDQGDRYADVIEDTYVKMDGLVGEALDSLRPDDTLIVMSDHGFASFRRGFNLNTWLLENGYIVLKDPARQTRSQFFSNVDWTRTRAYGLGLNGLYVNLRAREKNGIVDDGEAKQKLVSEIAAKLLEVRDDDGSVVIVKAYVVEDEYPDADPAIAPDLLVGYARNYRAGWATLLGGMPKAQIVDNRDRWSGDHCIAADLVPGILLSNRKIAVGDPALTDLAPTILSLFGLPQTEEMPGRPVLATD